MTETESKQLSYGDFNATLTLFFDWIMLKSLSEADLERYCGGHR